MMDKPTLMEILTAVHEFIENKAMPELKGRTAFHARVAANALAIAMREIEMGPKANADAHARLTKILGRDGSLEDLTAQLSVRIANGDLTLETPGVAEHLKLTTIDKVKIDQPKYSGLATALSSLSNGDGV